MSQRLAKQFLAEQFIENTPKGSEFCFRADLTGAHGEDGSVWFNFKGVEQRIYASIEDFVSDFFLEEKVAYQFSLYVGRQDDDGNIIWFDEPCDIDEEEDGSCVFSRLEWAK